MTAGVNIHIRKTLLALTPRSIRYREDMRIEASAPPVRKDFRAAFTSRRKFFRCMLNVRARSETPISIIFA